MDSYLNRYANWLDEEYASWGDESERHRVTRVLSTIDGLQRNLRDAHPQDRQRIETAIEALETSIADFGF